MLNGWPWLLGSVALLGLLGCDRLGQDTPAPTPGRRGGDVSTIAYPATGAALLSVHRPHSLRWQRPPYLYGQPRRHRPASHQCWYSIPGANATDGQDQFVFGWPSWSPDGTRLLFSGYSLRSDSASRCSVHHRCSGRWPVGAIRQSHRCADHGCRAESPLRPMVA